MPGKQNVFRVTREKKREFINATLFIIEGSRTNWIENELNCFFSCCRFIAFYVILFTCYWNENGKRETGNGYGAPGTGKWKVETKSVANWRQWIHLCLSCAKPLKLEHLNRWVEIFSQVESNVHYRQTFTDSWSKSVTVYTVRTVGKTTKYQTLCNSLIYCHVKHLHFLLEVFCTAERTSQ